MCPPPSHLLLHSFLKVYECRSEDILCAAVGIQLVGCHTEVRTCNGDESVNLNDKGARTLVVASVARSERGRLACLEFAFRVDFCLVLTGAYKQEAS